MLKFLCVRNSLAEVTNYWQVRKWQDQEVVAAYTEATM